MNPSQRAELRTLIHDQFALYGPNKNDLFDAFEAFFDKHVPGKETVKIRRNQALYQLADDILKAGGWAEYKQLNQLKP